MDRIRIFYAWQSDTSVKLNRHLIREAAEEAIRILNAEAAIEDAPAFELDHDTKDVPGSPIIAEEICKKIDACSLFLADVSFVARYTKADGTTLKWTPNPNVMLELGYARKAVGLHRIIGIMNTGTTAALGDPKGTASELPFDLAHLRHPITYKLSDAKDETKIGETRAELAKAIAFHVGAALETVIAEQQKERDAVRRHKIEQRQQRVAQVRNNFEQRIPAGGFRGFTAVGAQPILAFSMIPLEGVAPPLDVVARQDEIFQRLKPIGSTGWHPETAPGAAWMYSKRQLSTGETVRDAVTEIVNDGSIFAAEAVYFEPPANANARAVLEFLHVEREVFQAVEAYLRLLRTDLSIHQEVAFCLGLFGFRNFILRPAVKYHLSEVRPVPENEIMCPPVVIPEGAYARDVQEAAGLIRDAFNHVWQVCGLRFDPHIQQPKSVR